MSDPVEVTRSPTPSEVLCALFRPTHRDGPDLRVLDPLGPSGRAAVEQHLLDRLGRPDEDLDITVRALTYLGSGRAVAPMRRIMRAGAPRDAVRAAIALWTLRSDDEALRLLCRTVDNRPRWGRRRERVDAAAALTHIPRRDAVAALITALDDRDVAVSANADQAVRERLRLDAEADAMASGHLDLRSYRARAREALDGEFPS